MLITFCAYDYPSSCGGPFAWASQFVTEMIRRGAVVNVLVITVGDMAESHIATQCRNFGAEVQVLDSRCAATLDEQVEWVLKHWKTRPTEIFVANLVLPALVAARWIRDAGAETIGVVHSNPDYDKFYRDFIDQFVLSSSPWRLSACVVVSEYLRERIASECTSGIQLDVIPCGAQVTSDLCNFKVLPLSLLYCGRIIQDPKRIRDIVTIFLKVTLELPQVTASIYGAGPDSAWVENSLQGQTRVQYCGSLLPEEMRKEMAAHHVIVLLSEYEGSPIALIEGMLCGLVPICFSDQSWSQELISQNHNGILVNDRDESVIAAVKSLLDGNRWAYLSRNAQLTARQNYSYEAVMQRWWKLLTRLAEYRELRLDQIPGSISLAGLLNPGVFADYHPCRNTLIQPCESVLRRMSVIGNATIQKLRSWLYKR